MEERRVFNGELSQGEPHVLVCIVLELARTHVDHDHACELRHVDEVVTDGVRLLDKNAVCLRAADALRHLQPGP
eukprot:6350062-Prymnesium_polylepis.1